MYNNAIQASNSCRIFIACLFALFPFEKGLLISDLSRDKNNFKMLKGAHSHRFLVQGRPVSIRPSKKHNVRRAFRTKDHAHALSDWEKRHTRGRPLHVASPEKEIAAPATSPEVKQTWVAGKFDWFKQWYVVAVEDFLDASRPYKLELLGLPLVLWKDGEGKWRCFENACPHR